MVRAIDLSEVENKTSLKKTQIRELMLNKGFPLPQKLGGRKNQWLESEVDAWILAQFAKKAKA
ncbi:MAG TPA: AlpA family phage regulatory protein [Geothrix sp.]|nr:AlpA family phage regulatory protein [Geothrix sp.]